MKHSSTLLNAPCECESIQKPKPRINRKLGIRKEDVLINLVAVKIENWSFGNDIAQHAQ